MSENNIFKNAPLVAVTVLIVVTVMLFVTDDSVKKNPVQNQAASVPQPGNTSAGNSQANSSPANTAQQAPAQPAASSPGGDDKPKAAAAPMLANLIMGLEKKVAADPANSGNKMLLAQTYAEIGEIEKGVNMLREIQAAEPDNIKLRIVLASVLGKSNNPAELKQAMELLDSVGDGAGDANIAGSVLLQRGRLYIKMGETETARKQWNEALKTLPAASGYRKQVEIELARLN